MRVDTVLKLGQIAGVLMLAAGVTACQLQDDEAMPGLFLLGFLLYAGCRVAHWLRRP